MAAVTEPLASEQVQIDARNAAFWDELCGTHLARALGIHTVDRDSLQRFDEAYMRIYPYLRGYLELDRVRGLEVLEIGLGYGTVGQLLAQADALYHGLDIADGPLEMMRQRLRWEGLDGEDRVRHGSALSLPYEDSSFDRVVTIGCLHHTGDTARGVAEVHRVLRPGGRALVMLYNQHSLRQLTQRLRARVTRRRNRDEWLRGRYDSNSAGAAAPHVDYVSRRQAREMFRDFEQVDIDVQNFDGLRYGPIGMPRELFLNNIARVAGVDLYIIADKR
jgi:ubiquinone/menaquinone biosynthesis C-methylase UbiE